MRPSTFSRSGSVVILGLAVIRDSSRLLSLVFTVDSMEYDVVWCVKAQLGGIVSRLNGSPHPGGTKPQ